MYQVSDLAGARRREFLDEAKQSSASLRDTDGSVLVMLAAQRIAALTEAAAVTTQLFTAEAVLARTSTPTPVELGGLAWLSEFDSDDRAEALSEIRNALVLTVTSEDPTPLREALHAWVTTAAVMRDPQRRAVHTEPGVESDYVEVGEPRPSGDA
ncbi:hypothetical protein NONO_c74900 [Nocardia nova SH22a]|uniref:Uncharacterized protein n=1 Tax=Nocardia nova SH22a TaxID=1415166 RepID=W5TS87_9NOCA|nr:hypothetical protein [Nocardia nova]AHH22245.1 hypothetical protein NONO_c74900 [Nocardia nova SH22a]